MKNGFTMIELIFIIVILGILAAVAIPKLTGQESESLPTEQEVLQQNKQNNSPYPNTVYTTKK